MKCSTNVLHFRATSMHGLSLGHRFPDQLRLITHFYTYHLLSILSCTLYRLWTQLFAIDAKKFGASIMDTFIINLMRLISSVTTGFGWTAARFVSADDGQTGCCPCPLANVKIIRNSNVKNILHELKYKK